MTMSSMSPQRILVVDDDPSIRLLCARALTGAGYVVIEAAGSSEAMSLYVARTKPIDLLLIDLFLPPPDFQLCSVAAQFPRVNGHQLLYQALSLKEKLHVLFISSHSYDSLAPQGMTIDPGQFLQKPFSIEVLLTRVAAALAAPAIGPENPSDLAPRNDVVQWVD